MSGRERSVSGETRLLNEEELLGENPIREGENVIRFVSGVGWGLFGRHVEMEGERKLIIHRREGLPVVKTPRPTRAGENNPEGRAELNGSMGYELSLNKCK
jgi:hypothetical protein